MDAPFLQRRHLVSFATRRLPHIFTDVLVIGAGAAGLRAAIEASRHGEVILLSKGQLDQSNTWEAQGGLAAAVADQDSVEDHIADTLTTGNGLCEQEVVADCLTAAGEQVDQLRRWGMPFDTDGGSLRLGREGGHHASRILHADGDATGRALAQTLINQARQCERLKIFDECFCLDLLTDPPEGGPQATCLGALSDHPRFGMQIIRARVTILAAGGAGVLWRETSNPSAATADGLAMAYRAGAQLADLELMQFHPTTLYVAGATRSLISEAVRGEGGRLVDREGEHFMEQYHEMGDLAPRDIVSRAILDRMVKSNTNKMFLDVRHLGADFFAKRFPSIDRKCRDFDIDPGRDLIPVHPAAHYMIGGVRVTPDTRTSLAGLLACGEVTCTGLHGANRLASNSLTEALVFGRRAGALAGESLNDNGGPPASHFEWTVERSSRTELDLTDIRNSLRALMWRNIGIVRDGQHLGESIEIISFWGRYVMDKEFFSDPRGWEVQNMLTVGYLVAEMALHRTESRGVHFRKDFPAKDDNWARHQLVRRSEHQLILQ